jgi:hypothetical protein
MELRDFADVSTDFSLQRKEYQKPETAAMKAGFKE